MNKLYRSYLVGFGLSLALTIMAYVVTSMQVSSGGGAYSRTPLIIGLVVLAITQLIVQLLYFFHLGTESKPRLNTFSFLFMLMVIVIIGFGSLWIMYNLNYRMMPMSPSEVENHIQTEENIQTDHSQHE